MVSSFYYLFYVFRKPADLTMSRFVLFQTKKRYCGYMYETRDQEKPEFLAKGIETVRRDGCPAVAKVNERQAS